MTVVDARPTPSHPDSAEPYQHDQARFRGAASSLAFGVLFGVVGFFGFIPGATAHVPFKNGERFSGPASDAMLFHVFQTSVMANLIFLAFGLLGAVCTFFVLTSRLYFFFGAIVFGFFGIYGLAVHGNTTANFLPMNAAAAWLRLVIAVVMLIIGIGLSVYDAREGLEQTGR